MREIKFRALMKNADDAMFVSEPYGIDNNLSYLFDHGNDRYDYFIDMIVTSSKFIERFKDDSEWMNGWVHIENLQYTGIKDKNGVEIYEGYIISMPDPSSNSAHPFLGEVQINRGHTNVVSIEGANLGIYATVNSDRNIYVEVIGNIHENKELLEVG